MNTKLLNYSTSELQQIAAKQQEQIEQNNKLLHSHEQHLKYLQQQQQTLMQKNLKQLHGHQQNKYLCLKMLQNQINQLKNLNPANGLFKSQSFFFL